MFRLQFTTTTLILLLAFSTSTTAAAMSTSTSKTLRSVSKLFQTTLDKPRPGFETRNIGPANIGTDLMDPFVNLDDFVMDRPVFGAHPHAGFSAVTYMFEDSVGAFRNRWSKGDEQEIIGPGSIHWTQAGSGMMHEEIPIETGKPCHGLQMFVKLPESMELSPPVSFHLDPPDIPEYNEKGVRVRVLVGSYGGISSHMVTGNPGLVYLDVHLEAGAVFTAKAPSDTTAFFFNIQGSTICQGTVIPANSAAVLNQDADDLEITTSKDSSAQFLFCSGTPNKEPLVSGGPFMMTTQDRIIEARTRFRNGDMGDLQTSF